MAAPRQHSDSSTDDPEIGVKAVEAAHLEHAAGNQRSNDGVPTASGDGGKAEALDGLSAGAEAAAVIMHDSETEHPDVLLRLECETTVEVAAIIRMLRVTIAVAMILAIVLLVVKTSVDDSRGWVKGRGIAYVNVSIACICILLMSAAFGQFMTRLYRVWGSQWSQRRRRLVAIYVFQLSQQIINAVFFLVPNAALIYDHCALFSRLANASNFIRLTCLNTLFALLALAAHSSTPWQQKGSRMSTNTGGKFGGQSSGSSLLLDAPWYMFWPEVLLWAAMEGAIATMFATAQKPAAILGTDCAAAEFVCRTGQSKATKITAGILALGHLLFTVLTLWYLRRALNALQSRSHSENRVGNIVAHLQARTTILGVLTMFLASVVLWFSGLNSCSSHLYTWFGIAPVQLISAGLVTTMALFVMPMKAAERLSTLRRAQLQVVTWGDSQQRPRVLLHSDTSPGALFNFETALKAWYWSWVAYEYAEVDASKEAVDADAKNAEALEGPVPTKRQNVGTALQLFGLSSVEVVRCERYDSKALIAAGGSTIVVAFRGTASKSAALADLQVWMKRHPCDAGRPWWRRNCRVHAGFLKAWLADGFSTAVLACVHKLAAGIDPSSLRVLTTGHSLGGSLASLAAFDIARELQPGRLECYSYGAPRMGNRRFTSNLGRVVPHNMNIVNDQDTVCWTAKGWFRPYARQGCLVHINQHGDIIVRPNPLEQRFLLKLYMPGGSIKHHWMRAYLDSLTAVMAVQAGSKGLPGGMAGVTRMLQTSSTLETLLQDAGVDVHALLANGGAVNGVEAKQDGENKQQHSRQGPEEHV